MPIQTIPVAVSVDDADVGYTGATYPPVDTVASSTTRATILCRNNFTTVAPSYRLSNGLFRFDTSAIPSTATINSATFRFYLSTRTVNNTPMRYVGEPYVWGTLGTEDYSTAPGSTGWSIDAATLVVGQRNDVAVAATAITKAGITELRTGIILDVTPTANNQINIMSKDGFDADAGVTVGGIAPTLIVDYTEAATTPVIRNATVTLTETSTLNSNSTRERRAGVDAAMSSDVVEAPTRERFNASSISSSSDLVLQEMRHRFRSLAIAVESGMALHTIVERARAAGINVDTNIVPTAAAFGDVLASLTITMESGVGAQAIREKASALGITFSTSTVLDAARERTREVLLSGETSLDSIVGITTRYRGIDSIVGTAVTAQQVIDKISGASLAVATQLLSGATRELPVGILLAQGSEMTFNQGGFPTNDPYPGAGASPSGYVEVHKYRATNITSDSNLIASIGAMMDVLATVGIDTSTLTTIAAVINKSREIGLNVDTSMSAQMVRERALELGIGVDTGMSVEALRERFRKLTEQLSTDFNMQTIRERLREVGISGGTVVEVNTGRTISAALSVDTGSVIETLAQRWRYPTIQIVGSTETIILTGYSEYIKPGMRIAVRQLIKSGDAYVRQSADIDVAGIRYRVNTDASVSQPAQAAATEVRHLIVADVDDNGNVTAVEEI